MEVDQSYLSKLVLGLVRGGMFLYMLMEDGYINGSSYEITFSYKFRIPSPWRVSYII